MSVPVWRGGIDPQVNKFEQVSSDEIQMSIEGVVVPRSDVLGGGRGEERGRCPGLMSRWGKGVPYYVTYPMMHPPCEQTHSCENITFLQLCLRAVIRQTCVIHPPGRSGQCFVGFSSEQIKSVICDIMKL